MKKMIENLKAQLNIPDFLQIKQSSVNTQEPGIWCSKAILTGEKFGPLNGDYAQDITDDVNSRYVWEVLNPTEGTFEHYLHATDDSKRNWPWHINCAQYFEEQNLVSVQDGLNVYYKVIKNISPGEELLVWFDHYEKKKTSTSANFKKDDESVLEKENDLSSKNSNNERKIYSKMKGKYKQKKQLLVLNKERKPINKTKIQTATKGKIQVKKQKELLKKYKSQKQPNVKVKTKKVNSPKKETHSLDRKKLENGKIMETNLHVDIGPKYEFKVRPCHVVAGRLGRKIYKCDICSGIYRHIFSLKRHFLRNHVDKKYISQADAMNCNIRLTDNLVLEHLENINPLNEENNRTQEKKEDGDHVTDCPNKVMPGLYVCHLCTMQYDSLSKLSEHVQNHPTVLSKLSYPCTKCDMRFARKPNLVRHLAVHSGTNKTYFCHKCSDSFPNSKSFKRHTDTAHAVNKTNVKSDVKIKHKISLVQKLGLEQGTVAQKRKPKNNETGVNVKKSKVVAQSSNITSAITRSKVCSSFTFSCTICKKRFDDYRKMCLHRRKVHAGVNHTKTNTSIMSPENKPSAYANVSHVIAENLAYYIDGTSDALANCSRHIRDYDEFRMLTVPPPKAVELKWEKYNFPKDFKPQDAIESTAMLPTCLNSDHVHEEPKSVSNSHIRSHICPVCRLVFYEANGYMNHLLDEHNIKDNDESMQCDDEDSRSSLASNHSDTPSNAPVSEYDADSKSEVQTISSETYEFDKTNVPEHENKDNGTAETSSKEGNVKTKAVVARKTKKRKKKKYRPVIGNPEDVLQNVLKYKAICGVCKKGFDDFGYLFWHQHTDHPNIECTYIEVVNGDESRILDQMIPNPFGVFSLVKEQEVKTQKFLCTKCGKKFENNTDLHCHIWDCSGAAEKEKEQLNKWEEIWKNSRRSSKQVKKDLKISEFSKKNTKINNNSQFNAKQMTKTPTKITSSFKIKKSSIVSKKIKNASTGIVRKRLLLKNTQKKQNHGPTKKKHYFNCTKCKKVFKTPAVLGKHTKGCTGLRNLSYVHVATVNQTCQYCGKTFIYMGSLKNHLVIACEARKEKVASGEISESDWSDLPDVITKNKLRDLERQKRLNKIIKSIKKTTNKRVDVTKKNTKVKDMVTNVTSVSLKKKMIKKSTANTEDSKTQGKKSNINDQGEKTSLPKNKKLIHVSSNVNHKNLKKLPSKLYQSHSEAKKKEKKGKSESAIQKIVPDSTNKTHVRVKISNSQTGNKKKAQKIKKYSKGKVNPVKQKTTKTSLSVTSSKIKKKATAKKKIVKSTLKKTRHLSSPQRLLRKRTPVNYAVLENIDEILEHADDQTFLMVLGSTDTKSALQNSNPGENATDSVKTKIVSNVSIKDSPTIKISKIKLGKAVGMGDIIPSIPLENATMDGSLNKTPLLTKGKKCPIIKNQIKEQKKVKSKMNAKHLTMQAKVSGPVTIVKKSSEDSELNNKNAEKCEKTFLPKHKIMKQQTITSNLVRKIKIRGCSETNGIHGSVQKNNSKGLDSKKPISITSKPLGVENNTKDKMTKAVPIGSLITKHGSAEVALRKIKTQKLSLKVDWAKISSVNSSKPTTTHSSPKSDSKDSTSKTEKHATGKQLRISPRVNKTSPINRDSIHSGDEPLSPRSEQFRIFKSKAKRFIDFKKKSNDGHITYKPLKTAGSTITLKRNHTCGGDKSNGSSETANKTKLSGVTHKDIKQNVNPPPVIKKLPTQIFLDSLKSLETDIPSVNHSNVKGNGSNKDKGNGIVHTDLFDDLFDFLNDNEVNDADDRHENIPLTTI